MANIVLKDLARMYSATTGDSTITLTTAVPGCKTFAEAGVADSDNINYAIVTYDTSTGRPTGTEMGIGKYIASGTQLQRTTVLSSISSDSDDTEDAQITLTGLSEVFIPWLTKDVLRVKESDSDPSVYPVNTLIVSNGTLTDNGDGVVTVTTGGGGGGGLDAGMLFISDAVTGITDNSTASLLQSGVSAYDDFGTAFATWDSDNEEIVVDTAGYYQITYNVLVQAAAGNLGAGKVTAFGTWSSYYYASNTTMSAVGFTFTETFHMAINDVITLSINNDTAVTVQAQAIDIAIIRLHT